MRDNEVRTLVRIAKGVAIGIIACILLTLMFGCKNIEYVPVESSHVEHHWHTDSVKQIDSVISEKNILIRELDSAAMAKYGIQLKNAQMAFLIQTQEFERQVKELREEKKDTAYIEKEKKVPVPTERKLNRWEQFKMDYGAFALGGSALAVVIIITWIIVWIRRKIIV